MQLSAPSVSPRFYLHNCVGYDPSAAVMTASRVRVQTSPSLDLALFAIDATANVVVIGQTIIDSSGGNDKAAAPFCRNLCNVLRSIRTLLEQQRESNSATPKKAVTGLLNNLERLCNVGFYFSFPPISIISSRLGALM